jgi:hypothetical protein
MIEQAQDRVQLQFLVYKGKLNARSSRITNLFCSEVETKITTQRNCALMHSCIIDWLHVFFSFVKFKPFSDMLRSYTNCSNSQIHVLPKYHFSRNPQLKNILCNL